ncbi:MAG TPA: hypothetical protein VN253_30255 [Kofleriaceae bacterium]|nr:hypothetical protein [Kofleriaceae bacterium]
MAHVYDTGLSTAQRTAIRDALITRLSPLLRTSTPALYLRAIKTLARPVRGHDDAEAIQALIPHALLGQAPAIGIALGRATFDGAGSLPTENRGELDLALYVISQHHRDVTEGRLYGDPIAAGDVTADPGIWTMLEHARELVAGQDMGVDGVAEPRLVSEDEIITAADATVWEQRYTVGLTTVLNPSRGVTQLLLEIEGQHQVEGSDGGPPTLDPLVTLATLEEP